MNMFKVKNSSRNGFTLIELLVVIAIIGILASVVMASLNSARAKSRDAWKKSQLKSMQTALELYYSEHGRYPSGGCDSGSWSTSSSCPTNYISGLSPYMSDLPVGLQSGQYFLYSARSYHNYQGYTLMYYSPETETVDGSHALSRCPDSCASGTWCATTGHAYNAGYYSVSNGAAVCQY